MSTTKQKLNAVILTQYPKAGYYDACSKELRTYFSLPFMRSILQHTGLDLFLNQFAQYGMDHRIQARHGQYHSLFVQRAMQLGAGLDRAFPSATPVRMKSAWVRALITGQQKHLQSTRRYSSLDDGLLQAAVNIAGLGESLSGPLRGFREGWKRYETTDMASVLLMTATNLEDDVLFSLFRERGFVEVGKRTSSVNVYTEISAKIV